MNERFKFRVWDKYIQSYVKENLGEEYVWIEDDGQLGAGIEDSCILEQCTGLKDRNGNLIYENDVVQYWWNQKTNTGTIFWNNEFARFCIANNETHCPEDSNCLMFVADKKIIEIIGNVHEQAEQKDK